MSPPERLTLAVEMRNLESRIEGYRLAANELLDRAEDLREELAEKADLFDVIRLAERELEHPMRMREARVR